MISAVIKADNETGRLALSIFLKERTSKLEIQCTKRHIGFVR